MKGDRGIALEAPNRANARGLWSTEFREIGSQHELHSIRDGCYAIELRKRSLTTLMLLRELLLCGRTPFEVGISCNKKEGGAP